MNKPSRGYELLIRQSIGVFNNVKSVLGPNPLLWLWPQQIRGDGLSFPVNPDAGGESAGAAWADLVSVSRRPLQDEGDYHSGTRVGYGAAGDVGGYEHVHAHAQASSSMPSGHGHGGNGGDVFRRREGDSGDDMV